MLFERPEQLEGMEGGRGRRERRRERKEGGEHLGTQKGKVPTSDKEKELNVRNMEDRVFLPVTAAYGPEGKDRPA